MDKKDKMANLWCLAVVAALKRAQELCYECSGELVDGEKLWYEVPFWGNINKVIVKSIWRHYYK